jgi:DNA-binding response OmpR family regulator
MANTRHKILIVEDEIDLLGVLSQNFSMEKFEVLQASNGEVGLEQALRHHPDIILLDIIMPVMDGITMLKKLREDAWGKDAQVVLLTNLSDEKKVAEAMQHGVYDYLVKADWNINNVVEKVRSKLKK